MSAKNPPPTPPVETPKAPVVIKANPVVPPPDIAPTEASRQRVKISVGVAEILVIVAGFKRANLPTKGTMTVLRDIHFHSGGATMTDLDFGVTHPIEEIPPVGKGFTVPLAHLIQFLEGADKAGTLTLSAELVRFKETENNYSKVKVSVMKRGVAMTSELLGKLSDDFPAIPVVANCIPQIFDVSTQAAIADCIPFASTDESRAIMNSIFVNPANGGIAATDGRRLQVFNGFNWRNLKNAFILSVSHAKSLLALTDKKSPPPWRVRPSADGKLLQVSIGKWEVVARLGDGVFPNYVQVIPKWPACYASFSAEEAVRLAETIALMPPANFESDPSANKPTVLITLNGELSFGRANNKVVSTAKTFYPKAEADKRGYIFVSVAEQFLCDALAAGHTEIGVSDELSPVVLRGPGRIHVLMPLRLT